MSFYGLGTKPLLDKRSEEVPQVKQVRLVDDAYGAGRLNELKDWWDIIILEGQKISYYVNESKSRLILKDSSQLETAKQIFQNSNIKFTCKGERYLGAALGTEEFKITYVNEKVGEWCKGMKNLSKLAKTQLHAAFSAYIHGEQHKFTYFLRTIEGMNEHNENLSPSNIWRNTIVPRKGTICSTRTGRRFGHRITLSKSTKRV